MRISVIVASYNYEQYIEETLNSLVCQSEAISEIIVVDDGSKDKSVDIISKFQQKYKNLRLIQHTDKGNHGLPASIELALSYATGDYVAFCESDDYWHEDHHKNLQRFLRTHPNANFIVNTVTVINLTNSPIYIEYIDSVMKLLESKNNQNIFAIESSNNVVPTFSAVCLKKSLLKNCNFSSPLPQYLDYWLWRQILLTTKLNFCPDAVTYWRKHTNSYDATHHVQDISGFLNCSDKLLRAKKPFFILFMKIKRKFIQTCRMYLSFFK